MKVLLKLEEAVFLVLAVAIFAPTHLDELA